MSTNKNLLTSPVGTIEFMAAENPLQQKDKEVYTIKLAFDVEKDKEFLSKVAEVNDAKVVTAKSYRGKVKSIQALLDTGKALVSANTIYKPIVWDNKGNELEECPLFFEDSKGTAQMIVEPWKGDKGGTINLMGIIIHSVEGTGESTGASREDRLARLREIVAKATNNT